jgi:glycosyl hydrolase family 2
VTAAGHRIDLRGEWEFLPRPSAPDQLPALLPEKITVPGLWEAQGWPALDGEAWYRTWFELPADAAEHYWRLEFGAVMDAAEVWLNGTPVGSHTLAYTPFAFEVRDAVRPGRNRLDVCVVDHPLGSRAHLRSAHGKQGWMNGVFPSPPSLYMTYGGIWQPVALHRHAAVTIEDIHVTTDLRTATAAVALRNSAPEPAEVTLTVHLLGQSVEQTVTAGPGVTQASRFTATAEECARWAPRNPVLHTARARVRDARGAVEQREVRFGVRIFAVDGDRFLLNGEPFPVRAALVQGFRADTLYAEGSRAQIEAEVRAARSAGLNTLRLHIKVFDPVYLDVCDELGMLVHADIPIAEPIAHDELGDRGELAEQCAAAVRAQIRRDRNHPSIVLWSVMNELCGENLPARRTPGYEAFARLLYATAAANDPTRPIIENDWIQPDPDEIYRSPIMTAHWYGRLSEAYLTELREKVRAWTGHSRPFYLSEFGDWGLPDSLPTPTSTSTSAPSPFWSPRASFRDAIGALPWAGSVADFQRQTQIYQGISDRLQAEVFRVERLAGWCVTELTDVPQEYNGLWSIDRRPKTAAIEQLRIACQDVLPICARTAWTVQSGATIDLPLYVSNESSERIRGELSLQLDGQAIRTLRVHAAEFTVAALRAFATVAPSVGEHRLDLIVTDADGAIRGRNSYPLHVTRPPLVNAEAQVIGSQRTRSLLAAVAVTAAPESAEEGGGRKTGRLLVIGENRLDAAAGRRVREALDAHCTVVVLRQRAEAAPHMPVEAAAIDVATEWGSTPFLFTGPATLPSLPANTVLTTQLMSVVPDTVWTRLAGSDFATETLVGLWKPEPGPIRGTVLGRVRVPRGRLWVCQSPLEVESGGPGPNQTAATVLAELLNTAISDG